jgi:hypothetical protein
MRVSGRGLRKTKWRMTFWTGVKKTVRFVVGHGLRRAPELFWFTESQEREWGESGGTASAAMTRHAVEEFQNGDVWESDSEEIRPTTPQLLQSS